jgi:hypothetical protein
VTHSDVIIWKRSVSDRRDLKGERKRCHDFEGERKVQNDQEDECK